MGFIVRGNAILMIYVVIALLMYMGIYARSEAPLLIGTGLFLIFTSYFLTWDLLTSTILRTLRIDYEIARAERSIVLSIIVASPLRLKLPVHASLICSPHLLCSDDYYIVINGSQEQFDIRVRWFGVAEVMGIVIRVSDPLGIIRNSRLIKIGREIPIEPTRLALLEIMGQRLHGEYVDNVTYTESRMGDFMYLRNYNFMEPASNIHWITSARINELISVARSESGNAPRLVIMEYTPRMLKPMGDMRPIDEALMYLSRLRGMNFTLILIGNGLVRSLNITPSASLANLELKLRELVMGFEDRRELINRALKILGKYAKDLGINELMLLLYPVNTDHGLSRGDIEALTKYLRRNSLLLVTKDSFNELTKANIDLRGVNVIILGE